MKTHILLGFALVAMALPFAPTASAYHGEPSSCTVDYNAGTTSCTFYCHRGDRLSVNAQTTAAGDQWPRLKATCGGQSVYCQSYRGCAATSSGEVTTTGTGTCVAETVYVYGTCASVAGPTSPVWTLTEQRTVSQSVGPVATPGVAPTPVGVPALAQVCTPSQILCVGPTQGIPVATVPGVPSFTLVPASGVSVSYVYPVVTTPGVKTTPTGPIQVTGNPVPITLCATPCNLPSGVSGGVATSVTVGANVGSTGVSETITIP